MIKNETTTLSMAESTPSFFSCRFSRHRKISSHEMLDMLPTNHPNDGKFQDLKPQQYMGVSKNSGFSPKSSILIGFSIINHPLWDIPIFGNTHITKEQKKPHNELFFGWNEAVCLFHLCQVYPLSISKFFQEEMLAILPGHGFHSVKLGNTSAIVQRWDMEKRLRADRLRG